jgi:non-ribosomal peptide synthetase component F
MRDLTATATAGLTAAADSRFLLHRQFEDQARRTPRATALIWHECPVRFAELDEASNRVGSALAVRGIREGAYVGLHMERSSDYYAAALGILKAGSAVVPLPPSYPAGRIEDIVAFARLDAVIDEDAFVRMMGEGNDHFESVAPDPDRAAFVLCSSGSTGKPKMIVRSHRSFFHRLNWTWDHWPYAPGEVCCQKSHMTTTHSLYELFEPLLRGVPVHVLPDDDVRDVEQFWEMIREQRISRLLIVPSLLQVSLDMP